MNDVIELRQYTLRPGQRDVLVDLFDREFVETQEAVGIRVIGQFRDLDDPDRFVWLRGFADMAARAQALTAFYANGAAWRTHGPAANATMLDSDNVLLLRPTGPGAGFAFDEPRPPVGARDCPESLVTATIYYRDSPVDGEFTDFFDHQVRPVMTEAGARPLASFQKEPAENTFPALPVRTGENVFVWFASFPTLAGYQEHVERLASSPEWTKRVLPELSRRLAGQPQHLRLAPTARSVLH